MAPRHVLVACQEAPGAHIFGRARRPMTALRLCLALGAAATSGAAAADAGAPGYPDISTFRQDLFPPPMTAEPPAAGRRVRATLPAYRGTEVHHALYLPRDWAPGRRFPVIAEYAGNGDYRNRYGDVCTGRVEGSSLGFGLGGPEGFIWICLPFVDVTKQRNETRWWGDVAATVDYCKQAVRLVVAEFGGDPSAVVLCGFSRGALACNFIGLHDDEIAALWRAFAPASHYDGARAWPYPGSDRDSARRRLDRLRGRPVLVTHEVYEMNPRTYSILDTVNYLASTGLPLDNFRFLAIAMRNHSDRWTLCDIPERATAREWLRQALSRP